METQWNEFLAMVAYGCLSACADIPCIEFGVRADGHAAERHRSEEFIPSRSVEESVFVRRPCDDTKNCFS
jgi:hypothetical protein